jgi:TetR/AcrR family transcriptional regulator, transcriptional repressor of bet genes
MAIDQDKRRRDIAWITIDLIAREGLEAATIRQIAAEAGCSTTAITHYFVDKQELLIWTFQLLSAEGERQFNEALRRDPLDVIGALLTMVPWCPANVRRWKAYLAFWDEAARNAELASLLAQSTNVGTGFLQQLLGANAGAPTDIEKAAQLLNAIIQGRALQMLLDQNNWNEDRIRNALKEALNVALLSADLNG